MSSHTEVWPSTQAMNRMWDGIAGALRIEKPKVAPRKAKQPIAAYRDHQREYGKLRRIKANMSA
jgi:hypothetical protein